MEPDSPAQMHRSNPVTVATLLQTHPGVRAVAVIFPGKDKSGKGAWRMWCPTTSTRSGLLRTPKKSENAFIDGERRSTCRNL